MAEISFPTRQLSSQPLASPTSSSTPSETQNTPIAFLQVDQVLLLQEMVQNLGMDRFMSLFEIIFIAIDQDLNFLKNFGQMHLDDAIDRFESSFFPLYRLVIEMKDDENTLANAAFQEEKNIFLCFLGCVQKQIVKEVAQRSTTLSSHNTTLNKTNYDALLLEKRKNLQKISTGLQVKILLLSKILTSNHAYTLLCSESFHLFNHQEFPEMKPESLFENLNRLLKIMAKPLNDPSSVLSYAGKLFPGVISYKTLLSLLNGLDKNKKNITWRQNFSSDLNELILNVASLFHQLKNQSDLVSKEQFSFDDFTKIYPNVPEDTKLPQDISQLTNLCVIDMGVTLHFLCDIQRMVDAYLMEIVPNYFSNDRLYFFLLQLFSNYDKKEKEQWKLRQEFVAQIISWISDESFNHEIKTFQTAFLKNKDLKLSLEIRLSDWKPRLILFSKCSNHFTIVFPKLKAAFQKLIDNKLRALASSKTNPKDFLWEVQKFWEFAVTQLLLKDTIAKISLALLHQEKEISSPDATLFPSYKAEILDFKETFLNNKSEASSVVFPQNFNSEAWPALSNVLKIMTDLNKKRMDKMQSKALKDVRSFI